MKPYVLLFMMSLLFALSQGANGQGIKKIYLVQGDILDKSGSPLGGATVLICLSKDSSVTKFSVADSLGRFRIYMAETGRYFLKTSAVQFKTAIGPQVVIDSLFNSDQQFKVVLEPAGVNELEAVRVTGTRPLLEQRIDMLVYHVGNSVLAASGSALDVIKRTPTLLVDNQQNISLAGVSGVTVYLDGREIHANGRDLANILKSIPAADVASIEIQNTPSAGSDAAGAAGIINIRTKRSSRQGISGSLGAEYEQNRYNTKNFRGNLNVNKGRYNYFLTASHMRPKTFSETRSQREVSGLFDESYFSYSDDVSRRVNNYLNTGLDYYINKNHIIGGLANYFSVNSDTRTAGSNEFNEAGNRKSRMLTTGSIENLFSYSLFNLNYSGKFPKKGIELKVKLDYSRSNTDLMQHVDNRYVDPADFEYRPSSHSRTINPLQVIIRGAKLDYLQPVGKGRKWRLEWGYKLSMVGTDNNSTVDTLLGNQWVKNGQLSQQFSFEEDIHALYASLTVPGKKVDMRAGLRMEHTFNKAGFGDAALDFERSYTNLFPSITFLHKINKNNRLVYSFSTRIERPNYKYLNPFRIYSDQVTYSTGNPYLRPVLTGILRVGYTLKQKYIMSLSYNRSNRVYASVVRVDKTTGETVYSYENLNSRTALGYSLSIPIQYKSWLQESFSLGVVYSEFRAQNLAAGVLKQRLLAADISSNTSLKLGRGFRGEISMRYNSPRLAGVFRNQSRFNLSLGLEKVIVKDRLTANLNASDLFYSDISRTELRYPEQFFSNRTLYPSRTIMLSVSYLFRSGKIQRDRYRESGISDEQNRAN